ncbi:MAG: hypothetical protein ACR2JK_17785 [Geodermatophilaceae bacterium]
MAFFWFGLAIVLLLILVFGWRYDRRMRAQGRNVRNSSDMVGESRDVRRDVRVAGDQAGWSRTAASYTQEQIADRGARRDRTEHKKDD